MKKGLPKISGSSLAQSGSGTVTPAAKAALQHREFFEPAETCGNPGRGGGAQHQALFSGERTAGKLRFDRPILLDGAAPQRHEPGNLDRACAAGGGEKPRQCRAAILGRCAGNVRLRSRRRRARHRPR